MMRSMTRLEGRKKGPPSREKYERQHPTVSARLPAETRDKLLAALAAHNMSLADALKVLAGELEVRAIPLDQARHLGFEEAKKAYMVVYPCSICGDQIAAASPKEKEAAGRYMVQNGWGHGRCHEQTRRSE